MERALSTEIIAPPVRRSHDGRHAAGTTRGRIHAPGPRRQPTPSAWVGADLFRVLAAAASWGFSFSTFYLLPKFLRLELGAGPSEIGYVVGMLGVATVVFTIVIAARVDSWSRRHSMAAGALLMSLSAVGFTAVESVGVLIQALRVVQGASYALVLTAIGTLIADLVPAARLSQAFGLSGASMLMMNALAPAVSEPIAARYGWTTAFLIAAAAGLVSFVLAIGIREPRRPLTVAAEPGDVRGGVFAVFRRPLARHYAIIITIVGGTFGVVFTFEPPYLLEHGVTEVGSFFIAYAIAAVGVRVVFGHVPDRFGRHRVALASLVLYALAVLGLGVCALELFSILGGLFGLAHGLFYPSINAMAVSGTDPRERGRVMAIFPGAFSLGLWLGPTALGVVAEHAGYPSVFAIAAAATMGAVVLLALSPSLRASGVRIIS